MDKRTQSLIIWGWIIGIGVVLFIIVLVLHSKRRQIHRANPRPNRFAADPGCGCARSISCCYTGNCWSQEAMQIPAGAQSQGTGQITAGVPTGMNTNALENTYNQIADVMNKFTVTIYSNSVAGAQPLLLGSGVLVSGQMVLTNAHIVQNKTDISIAVSGYQTQYPVTIFRCDQADDLVILKVMNNVNFPINGILGNSDMVDRGDIVFAMGNAFGTGNLLANGMIINNKVSFVNGQKVNTEFQTNINIYDGSCGGPLVNIRGEVIGINNTSPSVTGNNYMGIGYATPSNRALALISSALIRPELGLKPVFAGGV